MSEIPRREFLAAAGGALAAAWLLADPEQLRATAAHVAALARQARYEVLSPDEVAVLDAATSQIIPSDETPGAREARVVSFIDRSLATWQKGQHKVFRDGVRELNRRAGRVSRGATFDTLTDSQQHGIIAALEKDRHQFFNTLRGATLVGMFANPEYGGNFEKNGWKMMGFVDQFSWGPPFGAYDR